MSMHLTTAFVAEQMRARGCRVIEGPNVDVTGGAADSRKVAPGDLFTAFPGENSDGNTFVDAALRAGAVAAICERAPEGDWPEKTIVVAPDATRAIGELAHAWRGECGPRVVGVTGTVGKTTAKELIAATLSQRFRTHKSEGNFNSREGLPLALMSLRRDHEISVLEIGMDSPGEIEYLCGIAEPEIGVVLNIGLTHVSKLGTVEAIVREKLALARHLRSDGTAVMNADDARIAEAIPGLCCGIITFGEAEGATLRRGPVTTEGLTGTSFDVTKGHETVRAHSPLAGEHTVPAALAAIGVCLGLGMALRESVEATAAADFGGRAHTYEAANGATIIDDRYNSSPASLAGALQMLGTLEGRRIAFLGRMAELGDYEEDEHRRAGQVAAQNCDILLAIGPECVVLAGAARASGHRDVRWFETKEDAADDLAMELRRGDTVLVKASRGAAFETILPILGGKR